MSQLIEYLKTKVQAREYYDGIFEDLRWPAGGEARTTCVFHDDGKTPSLHFNPDTGAWYCHGCSKGGNSVVSFEAAFQGIDASDAAISLYDRFVRPVIPEHFVQNWQHKLRYCPSALNFLVNQRGLTNEVIETDELGWNGTRVAIPIRNEFGLCVNAKFYDPLNGAHDSPKMLNYRERPESGGDPSRFYAGDMLYPLHVLELAKRLGYIVVCEGEFDALVLCGMGIPAVTSTNGSKSWPKQYSRLFRGLIVIIAYDNDKDGIDFAKKVVLRRLRTHARVIQRLHVPQIQMPGHPGKFSKDVTDWFMADPSMRDKEAWEAQFKDARVLLENPEDMVGEVTLTQVSLDQASKSEWYNKQIRVQGLVTGKDTAPYLLPEYFRASCNKSCDHCPLAQADKDHRECKIDPRDPRVLGMVDQSEAVIRRSLLGISGLGEKPTCQGKIEVLKTFNLEQILLIPGLDERSSQYVMRPAYFVGHGLGSNRTYDFEGTTAVHPQDQHSTHLFWHAKPVQDQIETFAPSREMIEALAKTFQPSTTLQPFVDSTPKTSSENVSPSTSKTLRSVSWKGRRSLTSSSASLNNTTTTTQTPITRGRRARVNLPKEPCVASVSSQGSSKPNNYLDHLEAMADWQSRNVTKIRQRPDLHTAVDLVYHSVPSFVFNGELVKRGMLDVLIVGDTRCGKGYVAEGLMKYYGLGEIASGESCSFAGLVGGLENVGRKFVVKWGALPLNNGRLVVIDEVTALGQREIGNMSRIRSEGIAEINKIITERTPANVRLIWLSNPRSGLPMNKHDSGLQVVKELVGSNEDISRYDFVLTVARGEVPSRVINNLRDGENEVDQDLYPAELCRQLVLWAWSRKTHQVKFTPEATNEIIRQAILFGEQYSAEVPIVQAENIRIKLAKISASVAARLFSTADGETLAIDWEHVATATEYLHQIYRKPSMAYDRYSRQRTVASTITDNQSLDELFRKLANERGSAIWGLMDLPRITPDGLADYVGDPQAAKMFIGDLVRLHCLARVETDRDRGWYMKSPEFNKWLRSQLNGQLTPKEPSSNTKELHANRNSR